jgi:hypothetical protein
MRKENVFDIPLKTSYEENKKYDTLCLFDIASLKTLFMRKFIKLIIGKEYNIIFDTNGYFQRVSPPETCKSLSRRIPML